MVSMAQGRHRRLLASVQRAIYTDPSRVAMTEHIPVIDETVTLQILDLAMRIGDSLLANGSSANETTLAISRVTRAFGLTTVHTNVTYNAIEVSYHRSEDDRPITLMRVVRAVIPDHTKLQRLQALITDIESGVELQAARAAYRTIRRIPFRYRPMVIVLSRALLAGGVSFMLGASWLIMGLTFIAALAAAIAQEGMAKFRVPIFFSQIGGALVTTAVAVVVSALASAGIEPFTDVRPSVIVAAGIVLMLSGLTLVGAAQDAIDGFALTAGGRILELTISTLGVVLGILAGLEVARVLGYGMELPSDPLPLGSYWQQVIGAVIVAVAVAVYNGGGPRIVFASAGLGAIALTGHFVAISGGVNEAAASGFGALIASFVGIILAHRLHVPSVAVTTAAIVPLVPGAAVFRGLLGLVNSDGTGVGMTDGAGALVLAATIGIGLAVGASLGLYLGAPVRASLGARMRIRGRVRG